MLSAGCCRPGRSSLDRHKKLHDNEGVELANTETQRHWVPFLGAVHKLLVRFGRSSLCPPTCPRQPKSRCLLTRHLG